MTSVRIKNTLGCGYFGNDSSALSLDDESWTVGFFCVTFFAEISFEVCPTDVGDRESVRALNAR